jgi:DNA repair protein RecO
VHREIATPAFVLHTRSFGESDRIVILITEQHGKVAGIAKGAKNSRRRFAGTLEPFVHVRAVFRQRPASDLVFLLRCELLGVFRAFTRDLDRFAAGSYVLELRRTAWSSAASPGATCTGWSRTPWPSSIVGRPANPCSAPSSSTYSP